MNQLEQIINKSLEEFDSYFGMLEEGKEPGDDCSVGFMAGCDDCEENQRLREQHKSFLSAEIRKAVEEDRDNIGRNIINMYNDRVDQDEILLNDILNYACRLKKQ